MLASFLGVLLSASLGGGPHAVAPEDVCLMRQRCVRDAVFCLVASPSCDVTTDGRICFVDGCAPRGPELPLPRAPLPSDVPPRRPALEP